MQRIGAYTEEATKPPAQNEVEFVFSQLLDRNVCGLRFYAAKDFSTTLKYNHLCYFLKINVFWNI